MAKITLHVLDREVELEVKEMSTLDAMRAHKLRQEYIEHPVDDNDEQILRAFFYPVLKHASRGDVPTLDEFLEMGSTQSNSWYEAVDELNPGALPKATDETEEELLEKKE